MPRGLGLGRLPGVSVVWLVEGYVQPERPPLAQTRRMAAGTESLRWAAMVVLITSRGCNLSMDYEGNEQSIPGRVK